MIANLASSNSNHYPDYDRSRKVTIHSADINEIKELKEKVEYLLKTSKKEITAIGDVAEDEDDGVGVKVLRK